MRDFRSRQSKGYFLGFWGIWDYQLCLYYPRPVLFDGSMGTSPMLYYGWPSHVCVHDVDRHTICQWRGNKGWWKMDRHYFDLRTFYVFVPSSSLMSLPPGICSDVSSSLSNGLPVLMVVISSFSMTWAVAGKVGGVGWVLNASI
jgi:hypothetical protein